MTGQRQDTSPATRTGNASRTSIRGCWSAFWHHPRTSATLRHPLFPLAALVAVCLIVEENYPFSDFPMYSSLAAGSHYFFLTDQNDDALPVKGLFGISASELKKIYHSKLTPMAQERSEAAGERIKASELGDEDQAEAGRLLLEQLLPRRDGRSWWKQNQPSELRLVRVDIHRDDRELRETSRLIIELPLSAP